jgi:hypothetical protein
MPTELSRFQILSTPKTKPTQLRRKKQTAIQKYERFMSKGATRSLASFVFLMENNTVIISTGHY